MTIVSFQPRDEGDEQHTGIRRDDEIVAIDRLIDSEESSPLSAVCERVSREGIESVRDTVEDRRPELNRFDGDDVSLLPPVADTARLICLGGVYASHLRESGTDLNTVPAQWIVPDTAIVGQADPIVLPDRVADSVEPAVELGIVIGRGGSDIPESEVYDHIAGYTIVNDVTARTEWPGPRAHKIMDSFSPCGPHIVPSEDVVNPSNLSLSIRQDGRKICSGSTAGTRFSLSYVVSFLSTILELRPGDIVSTGDPGGVTERLNPGSTVEVEVESVGTLSNPVKTASPEPTDG